MQTIIVNIDNETNAAKLFEALQMFKGVKNVSYLAPEGPIMKEIEQGLREVKMIQEGALPRKSLKQMLDEC
jgi:hypothetical protein